MQIITYLITGIILALANHFLFEKNKKTLAIVNDLLFFIVPFNIVSLSLLKYLFSKPNILESSIYTSVFSLIYIGFTLICGAIFLFTKSILNSKVILSSKINFSKSTDESTKKSLLIKVISILFFIIGVTFIFFSNWFIDYFGIITPEQFLFNLKSPLKGTSTDMFKEIFMTPVFAIIASTTVFLIFMNFSYDISLTKDSIKKKILSKRILSKVSFILAFVCLVIGVPYGSHKLNLSKVVKAYYSNSNYFDENYVDPRDVKMSFPSKKRNLIHIYLESIENTYLSEELGGYMNYNLMPELTELSKEGISFSNNDKFGGPYQTYGSSWSVAGMVNMSAGIPLKIPIGANSYGKSGSFLPGTITIGDILEAQGYNQTIMFGADSDSGGLTTFFNTHGSFNIFDYKAAKEKGLIPKDYNVWWGFEDDKLYEYAKDELTRLHKEGKPFNFTMETADTHFPDGYLSENVENKYPEQYSNVIAYSTKEAVKFIRWIQEQPFYENTTIVVTGDHLSMDKNYFKEFDPSYHRTIFNLILNAPITTDNVKNREFAPFDMFPTILASMDVQFEGDKLGLGTNLFSDKKTLIEEEGLESLQDGLERNSNYFNDKFISEKRNSIFENTLVTYRKNN
ncbi:MAG: LTA synthase family protein [Peptostreptococcaceae bacterium]|nr:LTA synthase family protein [Peptostreptococcaceae bacterium]